MTNASAWISAFRLRTLPLAFSSIICGASIAVANDAFKLTIFLLALSTTLFLQILSNLANDYGDFVKGTDNEKRTGPTRALQSGKIQASSMKNAIIFFILLSLISGIALLYLATREMNSTVFYLFLGFGILSILAAIFYTIGKKAYGYNGLGDVFVFLFFGILGVSGTAYLMVQEFDPLFLLPACSIGLLSTAVLNLNNMRDIDNDRDSNKRTIVVKIGISNAKIYHFLLIIIAFMSLSAFVALNYIHPVQWIYLIAIPIFILHLKRVKRNIDPKLLDSELKVVALSTFLTSLLFLTGSLLTHTFFL